MIGNHREVAEVNQVAPVRVTLVTVTFNSAEALRKHWTQFDPSWADWLVVDNASSDNTVEVARSMGARVHRMNRNVGFATANNQARELGTEEVVIFCNPDLEVTQEGIDRLADLALSRPALFAPQLLNVDGSLQENGRGAPYPHRKVGHMFGNPGDGSSRYLRRAVGAEIQRVVWAMGAAVAARRSVLDRLDWWDGEFFVYYEDHDLGIRALQLGIPTYLDGETRWVHAWARETKRGFRGSAWRNELRSAARFYVKHPYCVLPMMRRGRELRRIDGWHDPEN